MYMKLRFYNFFEESLLGQQQKYNDLLRSLIMKYKLTQDDKNKLQEIKNYYGLCNTFINELINDISPTIDDKLTPQQKAKVEAIRRTRMEKKTDNTIILL
jgi:hypothetical protein